MSPAATGAAAFARLAPGCRLVEAVHVKLPSVDRWETARDVCYVAIRGVLWFWGLMICGMAIGGLVFHEALQSERPPRPLEPSDFVIACAGLVMGLLLLLPFGWLAGRSFVRLALQAITFLLMARLLIGMLQREPDPRGLLIFAIFAVPPIVASWLIVRHRRRQRAATA